MQPILLDQGEGKDARISLNVLGAYICSSRSARTNILQDQKFGNPKASHYQPAEKAITSYFLNDNEALLAEATATLEEKLVAVDKPSKRQKIGDNLRALRAFDRLKDRFELANMVRSRAGRGAYLYVDGVAISIRPELMMLTAEGTGLYKLRFSTRHYSLDVSSYGAALLSKYGEELGIPFDRKNTMVVDVLGRSIFPVEQVRSFSWNRIVSACEEIRRRWPLITPRKTRG